MYEILPAAKQQLEKIKALCSHSALKYVDLPPEVMGVGIAIGFGQTDYVILSILGGDSSNQLMITSGIFTEIKRNRAAALEAANHFTRDNTAYPVYLHDADIGWALLMQQTHSIELLLEVPQYFNNCVRGLPQVVIEYRNIISENWDLGGRPWEWAPEDHKALLIRSMM